jgi:hypothetical protein
MPEVLMPPSFTGRIVLGNFWFSSSAPFRAVAERKLQGGLKHVQMASSTKLELEDDSND